ncbi:hypothetical protein FNV43_RR26064 [Rhamnella rubrinervis]|uniref:Transmembrane protein n=1 Tax=Rhamnella rubrinervis TaxID=2594499 RepID=A0A8K0DLW2_9ROSA|nr:hypothetical protein FNV43_RR26064 [Rhamnella rubrinervis]
MASSMVKYGVFVACFAVFVIVAAAHEGHDHHHMAPEPGPPENQSSFTNPSIVLGVFALLVSSLAFRNRV